ncbi:hypothetical protein D3C86_943260 [compost metagenome]
MNAWFTSKLNGRNPCSNEKIESTNTTSCVNPKIAPNEYCHCPNRMKIYAKIAIKASVMESVAEAHISSETEAEIERVSVTWISPDLSLIVANPSFILSSTLEVAEASANK